MVIPFQIYCHLPCLSIRWCGPCLHSHQPKSLLTRQYQRRHVSGLWFSFAHHQNRLTIDGVLVHICRLMSGGNCVLKSGNCHFVIDMLDGFGNQFYAVKINSVGILVIDVFPKCLKFLFEKIFIERIIWRLGLMAVFNKIGENTLIKIL